VQTFGLKTPKSIKNQEWNKMTETKKALIISGLVFNLEKDWLTPIHQSSALKKEKEKKKYSSKLGYFFSLFLFIRERYRLIFKSNYQLS